MDRPNGPRQPPPDKRHAAYESIFGRPGAVPQPPPANYPNYMNNNINYQPDLHNRRSSQAPLRQSIYHPPPPPNLYSQVQYPPQYPSYQPNAILQSNPSLSRARSINPNAHPQSNQYLTPAQAYQSQLYSNSPASSSSHSVWSGSPGAPVPIATSHTPSASTGGHSPAGSQHFFNTSDIYSAPRLGVSLEHDDGRLGIDFASTDGGSSSDLANDESELPWARSEPTIHTRQSNTSRHSREPSLREQSSSNPPLHVDTVMPHSTRSSLLTTSPSPSSNPDHSSASATLFEHNNHMPRRSSDSSRTAPKFPTHRKDRSIQDRSMSMPSPPNPARSILDQQKRVSKPSFGSTGSTLPVEGRVSPAHNPSTRTALIRKPQNIYPALLSRVAQSFRERIPICDRVKDGLTYKDAFDGREAVDKIAYIIKTTDRNLALLLGRALDAQKFFHDVTYDHRLRDSANELYQFRTKLPSPFVSGELPQPSPEGVVAAVTNALFQPKGENGSTSPTPTSPHRRSRADSISSDEAPLPSGVFTLLTDCYSPTCSRDQLCYSIACPRRLEQQARLNMKPQPGLSKQISKDSLNDLPDDGTLWIHSVPQEIVNSVSDTEKRRQEAINEVIYTERDFVRDMEYLRDVWINRLQEEDIIPAHKRTDFLAQVFWNVHDIIAVNTRLRDALTRRQKSYAVVDKIGDILLEAVPHFGPFVSYGAHQLYGKYEFEKEKSTNPAFAQFVELTERLPESRKLELNAYLTKPTTRLARYPLLLEAVLKHTPSDSPDKQTLPQVVALVREFLGKVNTESGKTENRFNLVQLEQQLVFKPGEEVNLRLTDEGREMVYKGALNKRDGEIHVYLFDHALLFTKLSKTKQHEQYKVYRRPIPLELLHVASSAIDESASATGTIRSQQRQKQALVRRSSFERNNRGVPHVVSAVTTLRGDKGQPVIIFTHLGRKYQVLQLYASSPMAHKKWLEMIYKQQQIMRERTMMFDTVTLSEGFFHGPNKVNCAAPYSGGRRVVYGTDDGVYLSDMLESGQEPVKVLALLDVMQVDVLEDYQLLIVLSERQVITFPLDALDPLDPMAGLKRAKRISSHTSFFKAGFCLGRVLVCIVKSSQLSSTFKTLEPIDQNIRGRAKPTFKKLLNGGNDTLKMFKEFYIPVESTSIHYLKTKLCVGCSRGFEIVNLESLDTQGLLDPQDESLEFVRKRDNLRPMAIYRIGNDFLLCYDEFAFYVNRNGRRSRKDFMIFWEGSPTGFALYEPFVIAVEPTFVEIRNIDSGLMSQVIQGSNLRLLFADTPPSVTIQSSVSPQNPYNQAGPAYGNPYSPHGNPYGHPNQPFPAHQQYSDQYPRHPQGVGRQEILIVSDDRVLSLQPHANMNQSQSQRYMSDNISMASSAR